MELKPIHEIAQKLGIPANYLLPYGYDIAKVNPTILSQSPTNGRLILVTSITPTPLGEGKTVTTIGLSQGLNKLGYSAVACIRQPSLGPVFGVKGGAAGGGKSQVLPMERLNLHLTGDFHAITAAHNLASAALDARLYHEQQLGDDFKTKTGLEPLNIDVNRIVWNRVIDHNDRALRNITIGVGNGTNGIERQEHVEITAASELMAILALSEGLQDMRQRIGRIILAYSKTGVPITAEHLKVAGAMTVLMKDAIQPTLMQTSENTPVLIHAGPFANIAHGNSSVLADRIGMQQADYVVTEAGFGSDMGMEKYFNIKYRQSGIKPSCVVVVATLRSIKANSGKFDIKPGQNLPKEIMERNLELLQIGCENLKWHIENAKSYGLPVVIAINRFPTDTPEELNFVAHFSKSCGAFACEISEAYSKGGEGTRELAQHVINACHQHIHDINLPYPDNLSLADKIQHQVQKAYGAKAAELTPLAQQQLIEIENAGFGHLPLCMAKTQFSISDDPKQKNVPHDFVMHITAIKVSAGAGFIRLYSGNIMTMPGLGSQPSYPHIDIDKYGNIIGLT